MIVIFFFFKAPHRDAVKSQGWKEDIKAFDIYGTIVFLPAIINCSWHFNGAELSILGATGESSCSLSSLEF